MRDGDGDGGHRHDGGAPGGAVGGGQECQACPVCVLLQALGTASPEALQHLAAAGREVALAVHALVGARPAGAGGRASQMQRIDVE